MTKMKKIRNAVLFLLLAIICLNITSAILKRKSLYEGGSGYMAKLNEFYATEKNSLDYICIGSSHAYCTVNPLEVWHQTGLSGFVLATQRQPLRASLAYCKEAFKTQSPQYVILEGLMACYEQTEDSAIISDAMDPLRTSWNKISTIKDLTPDEEKPYSYFSIMKYHNRWKSLDSTDFDLLKYRTKDVYRGYIPLVGDTKQLNFIPDYNDYEAKELAEENLCALNSILTLCRENDAEFVLLIAPYDPPSDDTNTIQITSYIKSELNWANENHVPVIDLTRVLDDIGIDDNYDYYDCGHLDVSGAVKASSYIADSLVSLGAVPQNAVDYIKWQNDYDHFIAGFGNDITCAE